jgi:hypothetical protein
VDLFEVSYAALYLLNSGCQGHLLPDEFFRPRTMHSYFAKWSGPRPLGFCVTEHAL